MDVYIHFSLFKKYGPEKNLMFRYSDVAKKNGKNTSGSRVFKIMQVNEKLGWTIFQFLARCAN